MSNSSRDHALNADAATQGPCPALPLIEGHTYEVWWPFKRETYQPPPEPATPGQLDGKWVDLPEVATWVPGWDSESDGYGGSHYNWHGNGAMLLSVVSLHKPGKTYPERAFYTRQWRDPDGKVFGQKNLRCISSRALANWLRGSRTAHLQDEREEVEADWPRSSDGAGHGTASNAGAGQSPGMHTPHPSSQSPETSKEEKSGE